MSTVLSEKPTSCVIKVDKNRPAQIIYLSSVWNQKTPVKQREGQIIIVENASKIILIYFTNARDMLQTFRRVVKYVFQV